MLFRLHSLHQMLTCVTEGLKRVEAQMNPIMTLETSLIWPGMGLISVTPRSMSEPFISHISIRIH